MTANYITINNFASYNLVCKNVTFVLKYNIACCFYPKYITFFAPQPYVSLTQSWGKTKQFIQIQILKIIFNISMICGGKHGQQLYFNS